MRRGLGTGQGKGYKNIVGKDPKVHADAAKGLKQPQKLNIEPLLRQSQQKGEQAKEVIAEPEPQPQKPTFFEKLGTQAGKAYSFAKEKYKEEGVKRQQQREKTQLAQLKDIEHPLAKKLSAQQLRVAELEKQIALNEDEDRERRLFDELVEEHNQLRKIHEEITDIDMEDFNDDELKVLAVRHKPQGGGFLADFVGTGTKNPFSDELVRRVKESEKLKVRLTEAKEHAKKEAKPKENMFGDFFN